MEDGGRWNKVRTHSDTPPSLMPCLATLICMPHVQPSLRHHTHPPCLQGLSPCSTGCTPPRFGHRRRMEDRGRLDVAIVRPATIEEELPGMRSRCLEWTGTAISGMCMSRYIHIHCTVSLTCKAIQGQRLRYGFTRLGVSMTRPRSTPNVMVHDTAS